MHRKNGEVHSLEMYRQTPNISRTSLSNTLVDHSDVIRLNTRLQWIVQRQLQDETRYIYVVEFGAPRIRCLTVCTLTKLQTQEANTKPSHCDALSMLFKYPVIYTSIRAFIWQLLPQNCIGTPSACQHKWVGVDEPVKLSKILPGTAQALITVQASVGICENET